MSTIVNGLISVRALNKVNYFRKILIDDVKLSANTTFNFVSIHRWLGIRLDMTALLFVFSVAIFSVFMKDEIDPSLLAFSLQIILDLVFFLSITLRFYGEFENFTTSAQRLYDYTLLPIEDELRKKDDKALVEGKWPAKGEIEFKDCEMTYREGLDPALVNFTAHI